MKQFFARLQCAMFGHEFAHRPRLQYRDSTNWCMRCRSVVYILGLREE